MSIIGALAKYQVIDAEQAMVALLHFKVGEDESAKLIAVLNDLESSSVAETAVKTFKRFIANEIGDKDEEGNLARDEKGHVVITTFPKATYPTWRNDTGIWRQLNVEARNLLAKKLISGITVSDIDEMWKDYTKSTKKGGDGKTTIRGI